MIDRLIAILQQDPEITAEEIAEIFWLTVIQHQQADPTRTEVAPQSVDPAELNPAVPEDRSDSLINDAEIGLLSPSATPPAEPISPAAATPPAAELDSGAPATTETGAPTPAALPFSVPDAPALRGAAALVRALRPLQQRIASAFVSHLDEDATAQQIAETKIWLPVLQADLEPWLDLALVVDASASMLIWRRTVLEFQRLLLQYGFFRDVRTWSLNTDGQGRVCLRPGLNPTAARQAPRSPQEILDPKGQRLVLLVSDCVADWWQTGSITAALQVWARQGPTALVQVLPEWLWDRTALRQLPTARFFSLEPGVANRRLVTVRRDRWRRPLEADIKLPVLTLEPEVVQVWSQLVAGQSNQGAPGFVLSPDRRSEFEPPTDLEPEQQIQRFRVFASPMARRLAGLLAAAPVISLPVIRLIQEAMLRQSKQVHVAEVLLSGLFQPTASITAETKPDDLEYEFCDPAIRQSLREETPATDLVRALTKLIEQRFSESLEEFVATLRLPQLEDSEGEQVDRRCFARVAIDVLKRRGGRYAALAREIEAGVEDPASDSSSDFTGSDANSIDWQPFEFTVATVVGLQTMEVEVATVTIAEDTSDLETAKQLSREEARKYGLTERETEVWMLRQLGYSYRAIAEELRITENTVKKHIRNILAKQEAVEAPAPQPLPQLELTTFEFEVATIVSRQAGFGEREELEIQRRPGQARQLIEELGDGVILEMVAIPAGRFRMGAPEREKESSNSERPQHGVTLQSFLMGKYPVMQAQWRVVAALPVINRELNPDPSQFKGDDLPVEQISWYEAVEFCDRLSQKTGKTYRLPSEAEWEYACRAGTTTPFHFGETITTDLVNYDGDYTYGSAPKGVYREKTIPVGSFGVANDFGLYDMHGNVWEWCADHWHDNYKGAPDDGSAWLSENEKARRLLRGGSWNHYPWRCRSANRVRDYPNDGYYFYGDFFGFRLACSYPAGRLMPMARTL